MARLSFTLTGLDATRAALATVSPTAIRAAQAAVTRNGNRAFDVAQTLCPVDTGFMKAHMEFGGDEDGLSFNLGWLDAPFREAGLAFYPPFQEFGTIHHAAQPSIGPALDSVRPQFLADCAAALRAAAGD